VTDHDEPGSPLADEVGRLVTAVQGWAQQNFPAGPDGHLGADCQWCPLCQFMAVVRGERPEVTARVAEAGTALAGAFRALADAAASATREQRAEHEQEGERRSSSGPRVQRVDLGEPDS
jgi:hypothetical protein